MPFVTKPLATPTPVGPEDALQAARARLASPRAEDRWEAARQLAADPQAVPQLATRLGEERDEHVRDAILSSLARINTAESFEAVLARLRVDDASLRTAALDAMKLMPSIVAARLAALLHDSDLDIRILACDLARAAPPEIAAVNLAAILQTETDINMCGAAIDLLAEIGGVEMLPDLARCSARFSSPFLDFSVKTAATQITARSARPAE